MSWWQPRGPETSSHAALAATNERDGVHVFLPLGVEEGRAVAGRWRESSKKWQRSVARGFQPPLPLCSEIRRRGHEALALRRAPATGKNLASSIALAHGNLKAQMSYQNGPISSSSIYLVLVEIYTRPVGVGALFLGEVDNDATRKGRSRGMSRRPRGRVLGQVVPAASCGADSTVPKKHKVCTRFALGCKRVWRHLLRIMAESPRLGTGGGRLALARARVALS